MIDKCDTRNTKIRRTKYPPDNLPEILDRVNALPPDDGGLGVPDDYKMALAIGGAGLEKIRRDKFEKYIVQLPKQLQEYIGPLYDHNNSNIYEEAKRRYDDLVDMRGFLKRIAEINTYLWKKDRSYDEHIMLEYWKTQGIRYLFYSRITLFVWSLNEGRLQPHLTSWIGDLTRELEVIRIRECPICNRIFWAGRIDKSTCSEKKCGQVWRQRLSRGAWKKQGEQYQAARKKKEKSAGGNQSRSKKQKGD